MKVEFSGENSIKSLTRQRGDGVKARHIPELLNYISKNDAYQYHIWGFEEPENSLEFKAASAEAERFNDISKGSDIQIFVTSHSPSFYLLEGERVQRIYAQKPLGGSTQSTQGAELEKLNADEALHEGFYLPAIAEKLTELETLRSTSVASEKEVSDLRTQLKDATSPVVITEGRTDVLIIEEAWRRLRNTPMPFKIKSADTGVGVGGSGNGGAGKSATILKGIASDHLHKVIGIFDFDEEGIKAWKLDNNFKEVEVAENKIKQGIHGKSYAILLPVPKYRAECREFMNLPIEFLFSDSTLAKKLDGKGLVLQRKKMSTMLGGKKIEQELEDFTHFKDIKSGKIEFAEKVVPSLADNEFVGFEELLSLLEAICETQN